MTRLNLGCGKKKVNGFLGVDKIQTQATDVLHDLDSVPYPFDDNTISEILLDNVLEHLSDVISVMGEVHRILIVGGNVIIRVPYAKSDWAFVDPTHKHFFTEHSFDYFTSESEYSYYSNIRFKVEYRFINNTLNIKHKIRNILPFKHLLRYFLFNMFDELEFKLTKI